MAIYTNSSELDHTNLQEWDIVIIGWHQGTVVRNYISFNNSPLWHKEICETFHDLHDLAYAIYQDVSTISSTQQFPTFTNTTDATAIVQELMRRYNGVAPKKALEDKSINTYHDWMVDESRMVDTVKAWAGIPKPPDLSMYQHVPKFATDAGPVYAGQVSCGSPKTWSVTVTGSGSGSVTGSEPGYTISGIDIAKKKSRIVFPKIR